MKNIKGICIALLCILSIYTGAIYAEKSTPLYMFHSEARSLQYSHLIHRLRCLVCQNESLADSNAQFAIDLRHEIYQKVKEGHTSKEIEHYLVGRYGDYILLKPPLGHLTYILWFAPFAILVLVLAIYLLRVRMRQKDTMEDQS